MVNILSRIVFSLLCLTGFISSNLYAQSEGSIQGFVFSDKKPVEFASVIIYASDSTVILNGTYTDRRGFYHFRSLVYGKYRVEVSSVGHEKKALTATVDSLHSVVTLNFDLPLQNKELQEVSVYGFSRNHVGRHSYHFDKAQKSRAAVARDLVLSLPRLKENPSTGRIASANGEPAPLILINGVVSDEEELKMIPPQKIVRVDYYDLPPMRYNTANSVIDVITLSLDDGHTGGGELRIFPLATEANARMSYAYNKRRHRAKFFSNVFYRDTRLGRKEQQEISYTTETPYSFLYDKEEKFLVENLLLKGVYTYTDANKQTFQASVSGVFDHFKNRSQLLAEAFVNTKKQNRRGESHSRASTFSPILDLYYDCRLPNGDKLYANTVFTTNVVQQVMDAEERDHENLSQIFYQDHLSANNHKSSLIAQLDYAHYLGRTLLHAGIQGMYSRSLFKIDGSSLAKKIDDLQQQYRQRVYVSLEGGFGHFSYRITPALSLAYASSHYGQPESRIRFFFSPAAQLLYRFKQRHRLRLSMEGENYVPELGQTTSALRQLREGLFFRNNPHLKNSYRLKSQIQHSWANKYIDIETSVSYRHVWDELIACFAEEKISGVTAIVQYPDNAKYFRQVEFRSELALTPLGNEVLTLRFYAHPRQQYYKYTDERISSLSSLPLGASIAFRKRNFGLQADCSLPYKNLRGYFTSSSDWYSAVAISYGVGNWSFRAGVENLFREEMYVSGNHPDVLVQENVHTYMRDNYWKVFAGFSYYFSIGKEYRFSKELDNEDYDRGTL